MFTATSEPDCEPPTSAAAGEEVVVSEETAAFLVRERSAVIIDVLESGDGNRPPE